MRLKLGKPVRTRSVLFLLLAVSLVSFGEAKVRKDAVENVVRHFCQWDFDGSRLGSKNAHFDDAAKLVSEGSEWPDEPIGIVSSFHIVSTVPEGKHFVVEVEYSLLAELSGGLERNGLVVTRQRRIIRLPVVLAEKEWKINVSDFPPHVSVAAMQSHITDILHEDEKAGDAHRKELLTGMLSQLSSLQPGDP